MNNHITLRQVLNRLSEQGIPHTSMELQNNVQIVLSQYGGRILGPFLNDKESSNWINEAFADPVKFERFFKSRDWNIGGDRLWIAPEIQYCVIDRGLKGGAVKEVVQPQMDPGNYELKQLRPGEWKLEQSMLLEAYNLVIGQKKIEITRIVRKTRNPITDVSAYQRLMDGVIYAGYEQEIKLAEDQPDEIVSNVWSLVQLNPGGRVLTPTWTCVEYVDYYQPVDASVHTIRPHCAIANITGNRQFKVGYKASSIVGRMAYFNQIGSETFQLMVRNFYNNPSTLYLDEPAHLPGANGASTFIYNDDGAIGGFGEMEFQGQAIGGLTGRSSITETSSLWFFFGPKEKLVEIGGFLLGIDFAETAVRMGN